MTTRAGKEIPEGLPSIAASIDSLGVGGGIVLALAVLISTVVLRPFQISMVQLLEGYWGDRFWLAPVEAIAIERHARRYSLNMARELGFQQLQVQPEFAAVVAQARRESREARRVREAQQILDQYPDGTELMMPTMLGNTLRRAETTAGERYGLETVLTFPRLHSYLSDRLRQESETQLNVLDTSATLVIIFGTLGCLASPFIYRLDAWGALPIGLAMISALSYRGARLAAGRHGVLLASAYDLHRFDMLVSMHRRLPASLKDEREDNAELCQLLRGESIDDVEASRWSYAHPQSAAADNQVQRQFADPSSLSGDQADGSG